MLSFVEVLAALHLTINLKAAQIKLKGLCGIYCIKCTVTGAMYIGSSINLAVRLIDHLVSGHTNQRLQNAIAKYGLENFEFCVLEFCDLEVRLQREQHYLDILFSLPANLRYYFARVAEASFKGLTHTPESKAQIGIEADNWRGSSLAEEANHPMYGKVPASAFQSGPNNPLRFLVW
jgi:group I intron endonuclease